jgi:hypothetical protein
MIATARPAHLGRSALVVLIVLLSITLGSAPQRAHALATAPLAPVLYPAVASKTILGVSVAGWGTGGTAVATGIGASGLLPVAVGVGAAVLVGGALYVGYRHLSGQPIEWFWQDGYADPGTAGASNGVTKSIEGWSITPVPQPIATQSLTVVRPSSTNYGRYHYCRNTVTNALILSSGGSISVTSYSIDCTAGGARPNDVLDSICIGTAQLGEAACFANTSTSTKYIWKASAIGPGGLTFPNGVEATLRSELECRPDGGGTTFFVNVTSAPYTNPAQPPPFPDASCPPGSHIVNARLLREAPGVTPLVITNPMQTPAIVPAPSYVPTLDQPDWDLCMTRVRLCQLQVWQRSPARVLAPPGDVGWQLDPNREALYDCRWVWTGGFISLPLDQCASLQWEGTTGTVTQPAPSDTTTLDPPVATTSGTRCDTGGTESGFLGSNLISRGVKCALQWAFVPSPTTMAHLQTAGQNIQSRPPFSVVTATASWVGGMTAPPESTECLVVAATIRNDQYPIVNSCQPNAVTAYIIGARGFLAIAVYGFFLLPLAWWAWRQYAPGSQGMA